MAPGTIDYAASYFKYKTLTLIRGEPTHKALKRLQIELQSNTSSVEIDLGGSNYGHLALVLSDTDYNSISNTAPFVVPMYLLPLTIPNIATPIEVLELKDAYNKQKQLYLEYKNVEKVLLCHIQETIEDKYISSLVDEYTNLLCDDIPIVIDYLKYNYRKVRSKEVT